MEVLSNILRVYQKSALRRCSRRRGHTAIRTVLLIFDVVMMWVVRTQGKGGGGGKHMKSPNAIVRVLLIRLRGCGNTSAAPPTSEMGFKPTSGRGRQEATHRGNKGPFGMDRSSKSCAIFAAAWKPYIRHGTNDAAQR